MDSLDKEEAPQLGKHVGDEGRRHSVVARKGNLRDHL